MSAGDPGPTGGVLPREAASPPAPPWWAPVGAASAALLAAGCAIGAAALGRGALAAVLIAEQIAFAWAWVRMLRASAGTVLLVAVWGVLGDVVLLASHQHSYGSVAGVIGSAVAVVVLYQLGRRRAFSTGDAPAPPSVDRAAPVRPPVRITADMAAALSGIVLSVLFTGYLALRAAAGTRHPADLLVIAGLLGAGAAVVVGRLVGWAGIPAVAAGVVGVVVGAAAGAGLGALDPDRLPVGAAVAIAAAAALVAALVDTVLVRSRPAPAGAESLGAESLGPESLGAESLGAGGLLAEVLLAAVLPLACAAPLVFLVGRHLPG